MSTRQHHIFSNQGTPAVIEPASSSNNAQKRVVCIRYTTKMRSRLFYLSKLLALSLTVLLLLSVLMIGAEVETGALQSAPSTRLLYTNDINICAGNDLLQTLDPAMEVQNDTTMVHYGSCGW